MMGIADVKTQNGGMVSSYHHSLDDWWGIAVALLNLTATSGKVLDFVIPLLGLLAVTRFIRKHSKKAEGNATFDAL
jgi:hypothetical protein